MTSRCLVPGVTGSQDLREPPALAAAPTSHVVCTPLPRPGGSHVTEVPCLHGRDPVVQHPGAGRAFDPLHHLSPTAMSLAPPTLGREAAPAPLGSGNLLTE